MASKDPADMEFGHLTDEQLTGFLDGEPGPGEAEHLASCARCSARLEDIGAAEAAYVEYRDSIRGPLLPPPPHAWRRLDSLIAEDAGHHRSRLTRWWPTAALAAAAGLAFAVVVLENPARRASARATELLEQSASVELAPDRAISLRMNGRTLIRPAVLISNGDESAPEMAHLQQVFAAAHYSWREPLSSRSFQTWRSGLERKRDYVSTIEERGRKISYRVRTESPAGTLRAAALTLRAADLRAVAATFNFEGEGTVELDEAPSTKPEQPEALHELSAQPATVETPAGPEDALQVLAALNAIEADAGEPIVVSQDPQRRHVIVRGNGLSQQRQREIESALSGLPRVAIEWDTDNREPRLPARANPENYASNIPAELRRQFEDRVGGVVALQEMTDRALDTSASVLARAHAVEALATMFPVEVEARLGTRDRELLRTLEHRHLAELARLIARIEVEVKPLLPSPIHRPASSAPDNGTGRPWQTAVPALVASAQQTDQLVNRLLAGSYSQAAGEAMLNRLAFEIANLESAIQFLQRQGA